MQVALDTQLVKIADIIVGERQRQDAAPGDLVESIRRIGLLNPIILTSDLTLVAGERRLNACIALGWTSIPARFFESLAPHEAQLIELEENLKRKDLPWQDHVAAVTKYHEISMRQQADWTQVKTAEGLGLSVGAISTLLRVGRDLGSPKISDCASYQAAYNVLARVDSRKMDNAMTDIMSAGAKLFAEPETRAGESQEQAPEPLPAAAPPPRSILNTSFLDWAPQYSDTPFNFIHCDFPYGVNVFGGEMSGRNEWQTYDDSADVYWALIESLCTNLDKILAHSGHLMFWLAGDIMIQHATIQRFAKLAPSLAFQTYPLIWHKTDNVGILPDAKRGPRRVYETALIASREDKLIVKPVSNAYGAQTNKDLHPSTKPEPVLRHFFQMFVDETTRMLDPTCGSGSSLRAAESLGAKQVLGLELDPDYAQAANEALTKFRLLRRVTQ